MSSIAVTSGTVDMKSRAKVKGEEEDSLSAGMKGLNLNSKNLEENGEGQEDVPPGYYEMGNLESDVGLVYDPRMMNHKAPDDHPEQPQRIERIWSALEERNITTQCRRIKSREATDEELKRCHPQRHINKISDCFYEFSEVKKKIEGLYQKKAELQAQVQQREQQAQ